MGGKVRRGHLGGASGIGETVAHAHRLLQRQLRAPSPGEYVVGYTTIWWGVVGVRVRVGVVGLAVGGCMVVGVTATVGWSLML